MRLWLLILAVAAASTASDVDHILKVLNSWNPNEPANLIDHSIIESKKDSHSAAVSSYYLPTSSSCQIPGYTGEHCTSPICEITNWNVKDPDAVKGPAAIIDVARLQNCTQPYSLYVDETMFYVKIQLQAVHSTNPVFNLFSSSGVLVSPNQIILQNSRAYETYYNQLAPGIYKIVPSADLTDDACNMIAQANTEISVVAGFTPIDDGEHQDFPSSLGYVGQSATTVAHMFGRFGSAKLVAVNFFGENNVVYRPKMLLERYKCFYEFYLQSSFCPNVGSFYMQFEGITFAGNTFRRIVPYTCNNPPPTTAPPTTTVAPITSCANRGVFVTNIDNTTYCYCEGMWSGPDCSQIMCMNGGTPNSQNICDCPNSFEGQFCQNIVCVDDADFGFDADHPTIILVVRTRQQLNSVINQVANATERFVNSIENNQPGYLRSYALVLFNEDYIILNKRYTDSKLMLTQLRQFAQNASSSGGCSDYVLNGLLTALSMFYENKSPIYLVTDAIPDDISLRELTLAELSIWRLPVNVIFVKPTSDCHFNTDDANFRGLDEIAKKSGGMTFIVSQTTNIQEMLYQHMASTVYRAQMLLSNDLDVCDNQNSYQVVAVDVTVDQLVIVATGSYLSLTITAPDQSLNIPQVIYTDGFTSIWGIRKPQSGNYFFSFQSELKYGACYFKVFQKVNPGNIGPASPDHDLFWAFTSIIESDGPLFQPLVGVSSSMVAHLTNFNYNRSPEHIRADITMYTQRNGKQQEVFASNGLWRDGCTYNFYFPPFTCRIPDETIYFNFYARDIYGLSIQRAGVVSCLTFTPNPRPPTTCVNGGVLGPNNQTCYCPAPYTGAHCETITCYNGGTPMGFYCNCPLGWSDLYCTLPVCLKRGPNPEAIRNHVDMVFAVELTVQGFPQIVQLNTYFAELLKDIQSQDQNWIGNYVLVGFNSTSGDIIHESPSWNPTGIIHALNTLAKTIPKDTGCTVQLYRALDRVARRIAPGSYVEIFLTSPPDNSERGGWSEAYEFSRAFYLTINGFLSYSPRNPYGYFCNATEDQYQLLYDLVGGSTGIVYNIQAGAIPDAVRVIPLQYSSGTVFSQWNLDCTSTLRMYFPVDSFVQTIQLNVFGFQNTVKISDYKGNQYETYTIMSDDFSGWSVYELRKPCDEGWQESGQYCIRYEYVRPMSYDQAQQFCSSFGAYMVDDLNAPQHAFLLKQSSKFSFWLGLRNNGSEYLWDRGRAPAVPFNQTDQFWSPDGKMPAYDPTSACVYYDVFAPNTYTWKLDSCSSVRSFICQRHRYDPEYGTGDLGENLLAPGKWYVDVKTTKNNLTTACFVEARVQSSIQLFTGFTTSMVSDIPGLDPVQDSPDNRIISYLHTNDILQTPILLQANIYDAYNVTYYNSARYQYRADCNFPWVSQNFVCPDNTDMNELAIMHYGEDPNGYAFQRVTYGHCSKQVLTCGNGGYRYKGTCVCDEYWEGKDCTIPICVNNGTLDPTKQFCQCPQGFTGANCQSDVCVSQTRYNFKTTGKTLAIVFEATQNNKIAINQLANNLSNMIANATAKNPDWFGNYVLIAFNSFQVTSSFYSLPSIGAVQQAIKAIMIAGLPDDGNCETNIFAAIDRVLMQADKLQFPESQILLFTASPAGDYENRGDTVAHFGATEAQLTWIYDTNSKCGTAPSDVAATHLIRLSYATDGNTLFINAAQLSTFLGPYLKSRYLSSTLSNPTYGTGLKCSNENWYIQVDFSVSTVYITTSSFIGSITAVTDSEGQILETLEIYADSMTKLVEFSPPTPGIYTINLSSIGICLASIYTNSGVKVYQYFAHTTSADPAGNHIDGNIKTPDAGKSTIATFHVPNKENILLQYVQIIDLVTNKPILGSPLYARRFCTFEFYSDPFVCQSDLIAIIVYGQDTTYAQFKRQLVAFCVNGTLPTNPPITIGPSTTLGATTIQPTTVQPTTAQPTTVQPTTVQPTTVQPTTVQPTTVQPTTVQPTTVQPTTVQPTTAQPTTVQPTTVQPKTIQPTTQGMISTVVPTTVAPVTQSQTMPAVTTPAASKTTVDPLDVIRVDTVFLLDVSSTAQTLSQDIKTFVSSLMHPFNVGLQNARVAIVPVPGTLQYLNTSIVGLNGITTQDSLNSYLFETYDSFKDFNHTGQYLNNAFSIATSANFRTVDNGFRPSIPNHVMIYVTGTTDFSDHPSTNYILTNNLYGVITVGYGPGIKNLKALQDLSGGNGCAFYAPDRSTLMNKLIPSIQELILTSSNNNGIYCGN